MENEPHVRSMHRHEATVDDILDNVQTYEKKWESTEEIAQLLYEQSKTQKTVYLSLVPVRSMKNQVRSFCSSTLFFERTLLKGSFVMKVLCRGYSVLFDGRSVGALVEIMERSKDYIE